MFQPVIAIHRRNNCHERPHGFQVPALEGSVREAQRLGEPRDLQVDIAFRCVEPTPGDGGISDARVFAIAEGLTWRDSAGRTFTVARPELKDWIGNRAEAGRLPPKGFPKSNRFEG